MIAFFEGKSLTSRLIRWRTWSPFSHVAWVAPDGTIFEAWRRGVESNPSLGTAHTPGTRVLLLDFKDPLSERQVQDLISFFKEQVGKAYDFAGVLGFVSRRDGAQAQDRWFCSELVHAAFMSVGIPLLDRIPSHRVDPGMLYHSPLIKLHQEVFTAPHSNPLGGSLCFAS